jgi:two-component system, LytTR family, sensor kinase
MTTKSWRFYATIWTVFHIVSCSIDYATSRGKKPWGWDFFTNLVNISALLFLFQAMAICFFIIWSSKKFFPSKPVLYFAVMSVPLLFMAMSLDYATSCMIQDCISQYSLVQLLNDRGTFNGIIIIFGFMVKIFIDYLETEQSKQQIMTEKNTIELAFLKSQINPHFLFNTLNNLYGLSLSEPEKTPDAIIKLSDMMRYMLYESNAEQVPLKQEIAYLKNYIELQKLRYDGTTYIHFEVQGQDSGQQIAPLLLIAFVENAFKHGEVFDAQHPLSMSLVFDEKNVIFEVKNKIHHKNKDEVGGFGVKNVERRLELLYPKKHKLLVEQHKDIFEAHLEIQL